MPRTLRSRLAVRIAIPLAAVALAGLWVSSALARTTAAPAGSVTATVQLDRTQVHTATKQSYVLVRLDASDAAVAKPRPVNLALVVDRSGSMRGTKIDEARAAALGMVDRLRDGDRVALISYASDVRTDVASVVLDATTRESLKSAIRRMSPGGSTNLSGGMTAGHAQVRANLDSDHVNRVVLLSDGIANRGVTGANGLAGIARAAAQDGIATSTVGVGVDYNEDVMTAIADNGGGQYHYVRKASDIDGVLAQELARMMATVAKGVTLELTAPRGVRLEQVYGYATQAEGPTTVVRVGEMFAGQSRSILMRVAFDATGDRVDLGKLGLRYTDLTGASAKRRKWDHTPSVATTGNKAASEASVDKDVAARVAEIEVATAMTRAADMAAEGRMQEAQKELKAAGARARVQAAASGGAAGKQLQVYAEEAESLADDLAAPAAAAPAERKAATKKLKAKGYGIKKR